VLALDDFWGESGTLGWRFLDKIVQLPLSVPALGSSHAKRFLGSMLASNGQVAAHHSHRLQPIDEEAAKEIEDAIQYQAPSIEGIPQAAALAQEQVSGRSSLERELTPEARSAARRVLKKRLRDDDPEVTRIVEGVGAQISRNPREIKRFVNVFRFFAVIRQERLASGLPAPETLVQVAKLAVLAVRWPHLRNTLGRQVGNVDDRILLEFLEASMDGLPPDQAWPECRDALATKLIDAQVPERLRQILLTDEKLCRFLASAPALGGAAEGFV
jgi:hypothetical protein